MIDHDLHPDPWTRVHVGRHGAFTLRTNAAHVAIARAAVAHRLEVVVGSIVIDWDAVKGAGQVVQMVPAKRRAA